ncbi:MAG: hypothetical protein KF842_13315 [Caulobacter sp.]|nr:hypothetical protein [Caulobacter sp.]
MPPISALLALSLLSPVPAPTPAPAFAVFASPDEVTLVLASNRVTPMRIADPRDVDGLSYSLLFIRVRGPDGELIETGNEDDWWTPLYRRGWPGLQRPEPWVIAPGETVTLRTTPSRLTRDMPDAPTAGTCRFQVRAVLRDSDRWPWSEEGLAGGAYTVESTWTEAPCASLFPRP